ncbi:MAG: glycosyltransferase [Verrucomicrobiota bacterium]
MSWSYSVVLTSCKRFDLLDRTLRSLLPRLDGPLDEIVVIEDSPLPEIKDVLHAINPDIRLLQNDPQLGQMRSLDRIYQTIQSTHAFHCEDDWEFTRKGFINESIALLDEFENVSMVGLRPRHELNPRVQNSPKSTLGDLEFFHLDPKAHPEYFSYSFNPGLRRMADILPFLPMAAKGGEHDISYQFKKAGFHIANLEHPAVKHIGDERHVPDPTTRPKPKTLPQRLRRSTEKRWKRLKRLFKP